MLAALAIVTTIAQLAVPILADAQRPGRADVAVSGPINCWWRADAAAVRVGEPFLLVLTCAVMENDSVTIVPDESRLDPTAIQVPPFEVMGGIRGKDLHADQRRFFQYQYTLRVINDRLFGKDVPLPALSLSFRVRTRAASGEAIEGREQSYALPARSIHVLSTVPAGATDIRDAATGTFEDIEARTSRARLLTGVGAVLIVLAALMAVAAAVRLVWRSRSAPAESRRLAPDWTILRTVDRELSAVQRGRETNGWTEALVGRALTALRVAGGYATERPIGQMVAGPAMDGGNGGALTVRSGLRGKRILVSAAVTAQTVQAVASERQAAMTDHPAANGLVGRLEILQQALGRFTAAQYGRTESFNEALLDESLISGRDVVRQLRREHVWRLMKRKAIGTPTSSTVH